MYTVKLLANTVSENLEREISFYIEDVLKERPGAMLNFQYQALNGINETIYSCMVTVSTSIIETHYQGKDMPAGTAVELAKWMNEIQDKVDSLYNNRL